MPVTRFDQISEETIGRLVDDFYDKIRMDPELGPIFLRAIPGDWDSHLATMRKFWSSVMLTSGLLALLFRGVAFEFRLPDAEHKTFWDRWLLPKPLKTMLPGT